MLIDNIKEKIYKQRKKGKFIIVAGVGSGLTAKAAEEGGADILATYNTAVYRMQGVPTALAFLPYDNCNQLTFSIVPQVLGAVKDTPVLVGLGAHDPRHSLDYLIENVISLGASGLTNEPFVGMYKGNVRNKLEEIGLGYDRELKLIEKAAIKNLFTMGWVFSSEDAKKMVAAGADIVGAMIGGVTSGGKAGGKSEVSLHDARVEVNKICMAVKNVSKDIPVLVHGGPLNSVKSVSKIINSTEADGYVTGSTAERIPIQNSICDTIKKYKNI